MFNYTTYWLRHSSSVHFFHLKVYKRAMERQLRSWLQYCTYFGIYVGAYENNGDRATQYTTSAAPATVLRLARGDVTPSAHNGGTTRQYTIQHTTAAAPLLMSANSSAVLSLHAWTHNARHDAGHLFGSGDPTLQLACHDSATHVT